MKTREVSRAEFDRMLASGDLFVDYRRLVDQERALVGLIERWRANADMLAEGNKSDGFCDGAGMQRACAEDLAAVLPKPLVVSER